MKQDSFFGGRMVWYDRFLGNGAAGSEVALVPGYTYTETNAGFTAIRGANGMTLSQPAAATAGAYADKQHLRARYLTIGGNMEMLCRYTGVLGATAEQFPIFWLRGNGTVGTAPLGSGDADCYYCQQDTLNNIFQMWRVSASAQTQVGSNFAFTSVAADIWIRFAVVGTGQYGKIWQDGTSEPVWGITGANVDIVRGSHFGLGFSGGNSGVVQFDNLVKELYVWDLDLSEREVAVG